MASTRKGNAHVKDNTTAVVLSMEKIMAAIKESAPVRRLVWGIVICTAFVATLEVIDAATLILTVLDMAAR